MAASYNGVPVPANGARITYSNGKYQVPDNPIVPFIEGDGTGRDIWKASVRVFDAAVEKAYKGKNLVPSHTPLALVSLLPCRIKHAHRRLPDIPPSPITLDKRHNRIVRNLVASTRIRNPCPIARHGHAIEGIRHRYTPCCNGKLIII